MCTYIYIYRYKCIYIYKKSMHMCINLSLYVYIYIYMFLYMCVVLGDGLVFRFFGLGFRVEALQHFVASSPSMAVWRARRPWCCVFACARCSSSLHIPLL